MEDKTLTCVVCNENFAFTTGQQEFFAEKGLTSEPKTCSRECKEARRNARFNKENHSDNVVEFKPKEETDTDTDYQQAA